MNFTWKFTLNRFRNLRDTLINSLCGKVQKKGSASPFQSILKLEWLKRRENHLTNLTKEFEGTDILHLLAGIPPSSWIPLLMFVLMIFLRSLNNVKIHLFFQPLFYFRNFFRSRLNFLILFTVLILWGVILNED